MEKLDMGMELEDDKTPFGGISYKGETLGEFLDEVGISRYASLKNINEALEQCGIKKISIK